MTTFQKVVKWLAIALAVALTVSIVSGIITAVGAIIGATAVGDVIGTAIGETAVTEDITDYTVSQDITRLKVDIAAADLVIKSGDRFAVESNLRYLTVEDTDGRLTVREKRHFGAHYRNPVLTVTLPDVILDEVSVHTGAGRLTADSLTAKALDLDLGAGEVKIGNLIATDKAEIDGGAGAITVNFGNLHNLDLDMGVGKLVLTSGLTGDADIDLGVGEAELSLIGSADDYRIRFDKGIGAATIDGKIGRDNGVYGDGPCRVDLDGGVGKLTVEFCPASEQSGLAD